MTVQPPFSFPALACFADNIYRARERAGLDQRVAAEEASISHFWLDRIEAGDSVPPLDVLIKLAVVYSTTVGALLAGIGWKPPSVGGPLRGEYVVTEERATPVQQSRSAAS
jgi:transcriptional regulator with XRE-family HTH domain